MASLEKFRVFDDSAKAGIPEARSSATDRTEVPRDFLTFLFIPLSFWLDSPSHNTNIIL
jgi:hypothetical protein